ncbi:VCBS repeat-containing protein [Ascidiimonas sp. W6]|uniref:VCBS repeat-containing protein n=1 Tax=Ascidiimonas meishanensis TaxID=3128903 RepID=UPI0030EE9280
MKNKVFYLIITLLVISCTDKEGELFKNPASEKTGIEFTNTITETDDLNILDYLYFYNGGGVAVGDINADGLPDIFFSGNQVKNKLYLNKGNLIFQDITEKAGVAGNSTWNTGAVMGDVNGDGLLDIYVCAVVGINGFNGFNELYINNGDGTFLENAAKYGLDFDSYSSSAAFLDYDKDGDLDIYLLNHAVHTQESFGRASLREKRIYETGDKLLRNDGDTFTDVSEEAGIYGGVNGYGLGIAISDFNQDGFPDIYVGNDFHEDDYYYLNNGNGTFTESVKEAFGHISRFSMGSDVADINADGWPDLISLDMLAEDETVLKSSEGDDNPQIFKLRTKNYGYHNQYSRNMLHINRRGDKFQETALLSGIEATDWSWSALFGDYNQDGYQDLFVSNGIPKRPNDLDYIKFVSNQQIQKKINNTKLVDQKALEMMPSGAVHNYIFKGSAQLAFQNKSKEWISKDTLISGATAYADLDNDGDLDLITNNINRKATLYINTTNEKNNYLKIRFKYKTPNTLGIGAKVFSWHQGQLQYKELYPVRGFQASSEPIIHFGYGNTNKIDSLRVVWPDNSSQLLKEVNTNQFLTITPQNTSSFDFKYLKPIKTPWFTKVNDSLGINYVHQEDNYLDFNRQKLIPYQISDRGPASAVGDLNNDGKEDLFFGGSKYKTSVTFIQTDSGFVKKRYPQIINDSIVEETAALIADLNKDGKNDLFVGTGGGDFYAKMKPLLDAVYFQKDSGFVKSALPDYFENAAVVKPYDYDHDGDLDIFVGNQAVSNDFGNIPSSYLLNNQNGDFTLIENVELQNTGMVTDAIWNDFTGDGIKDLILIGEWMQPTFFKNENGELKKTSVGFDNLNGLWQAIIPFDIDGDGDTDYVLGNWGTNTKFKASEKHPMQMYYGDFDDNEKTETIVSIYKNNNYYPLAGLDELSEQMSSLMRKKFNSYKEFAGKPMREILDQNTLEKGTLLEVHTLKSGYLKNENGRYTFVPFDNTMQIAPITTFLKFDFDKDGKEEILAAGNYFGVKPFHGKFDSFPGAIIKNEDHIISSDLLGLDLQNKAVRKLHLLHYKKQLYLLVTVNNDASEVYQLNKLKN